MFGFDNVERRLHALEQEFKKMALNFAGLQAAVAALTADVEKLVALVPVAGADAANQAVVDGVTASLTALDTAVKNAEAPVAATGATGP